MPSLVVGGITIPVAISSPSWSRMDAADVGRVFDNTLFVSQAGGAAREWDFETPPVTTASADSYMAVLGQRAAKLCSGDILQLPTMCSPELPGGTPVRKSIGHNVVLRFRLHEVQPSTVLLRYAPGTAVGSFSRSTTGRYYTSVPAVASAAIDAKRDAHYLGGVRSLLMEDAKINDMIRSEELEHAAWTKSAVTVTVSGTAPDGGSSRKIAEDGTNTRHSIGQGFATTASTMQALSIFAKAAERSWIFVRTVLRSGTAVLSWVNLSTGAVGTLGSGHTVRVVALASAWYRIEVTFSSGAGAGATDVEWGPSTGDGVSSYTGTIGSGILAWGAQHEQNKAFVTSYIPTTTVAVTREDDSFSMAAPPPGEFTVYVKFQELGTALVSGARVLEFANAADASPRLIIQSQPTVYGTFHGNGLANVSSVLAAGPAFNDVVELCARLYGDGSTDISQSINGAAPTSSIQSAPNALAAAWSGPLLWVNSAGTAGSEGTIAIQSIKIVAGARSLDEMRAA